MKKLLIPVVLGALALSTSAQALLVNIDFEELPFATDTHEESIFINDIGLGISLTVTAFTIINDGEGNIDSMSQITSTSSDLGVDADHHGLGVKSNDNDGSQLDGGNEGGSHDPDEGLLFTFSEAVGLTYINFGGFDSNDDFNLTVDGVNLMHDVGWHDTNAYITGSPAHDKFNFSGVWGKEILIWADSNSDSFRIDDFTVSIPEPSIIALMGLGLFGMGVARRKKQH